MRLATSIGILGLFLASCASSGGTGSADGSGPFGGDAGLHADAGTVAGDGGSPTPDGGGRAPRVGDACSADTCSGTQQLICQSQRLEPGEDCSLRQMRCEAGGCTGCLPDTRRCGGQSQVEVCQPDGVTFTTVEVCTDGKICQEGECVAPDPCALGSKKSNQGCDYWAVDLPNVDWRATPADISPADAQFAVVISNTDEQRTAQVLITDWSAGAPRTLITDAIPPRDLKVFELGPRNADQCGASLRCANIGPYAFRIQTDSPVVAYQFNPLNNTNQAYSNDASLLLPTHALGREYIALTGDAQRGENSETFERVPWGAFVSVVGTQDAPTQVTLTVPSGVLFDAPVASTVLGQVVTASISKYEVLTLLSKPPSSEMTGGTPVSGGGNLSGTRVDSSAPVAVFSGNMAVVMPHGASQKCCSDHMEEQMLPVSTWGKEVVAVRSLPRRISGTAEPVYWRITAALDGTTFSYSAGGGAGLVGAPTTLDAGQSTEFESLGDFIITANQPFLIAQFMISSNKAYDLGSNLVNSTTCNPADPNADELCTLDYSTMARCVPNSIGGRCQPVGDPSMTVMPPVRQFRSDYVFLTPLDYKTDFALIVAPKGTQVMLDGAPIAAQLWAPVGTINGVTFDRARVVLHQRGRHVLSASQPVGLVVGGYDRDVSYGYPGGLNLGQSSGP